VPDEWGRTRLIWDKKMECFIEIGPGSNWEPEKLVGPNNLVKDLDPYLAVGIQDPKQAPGHALWISGGRRQHRDELRARGMTEVGNEKNGWSAPKEAPMKAETVRESLARSGYYDGAPTIRKLRREQFR